MEYGKLSELAQWAVARTVIIAQFDRVEGRGKIASGCRNVEATFLLVTALGHHKGEQNGA